ncbi:helix-turn-helix transcriptional regulator [Cohnella hashimotonis]|uniref:AraC family transcriptional regulator n=1 Tax=Cohnella hashimotonis TaxID=2826895 RepID=A0ABT6T9U7_9BACL|nr:AraC family transcriptional regulator [Cohnella hashimotonis]MDI4643597.1 AraC family transcriptional regulator [Cohnella hashimotonis]
MEPSVYGFRHEEQSMLTVDSIGWQHIANAGYAFSGDDRPDCGHVVFQYTLSGEGWIEYEQRRVRLPKGSAFLVRIPGNHRYYYEENGAPWEVLWLNLRGDEASRIWDLVLAQEGAVIRRDADSPLISQLWKLYRTVSEEKITDKYRLSVLAYEWMLALLQSSRDAGREVSSKSHTLLHEAKRLMKANFASPLTLDAIARELGVNKYHFCRLFQKAEHTSPLAYLRDRRVEAAIAMLRTTDLPVQEVGRRCGFDSPSYFGKVFREYMNMSPVAYRNKKLEFPYDAIYYD